MPTQSHQFTQHADPLFSRAELVALCATMDARTACAHARHHWSNPAGPAVTYNNQIWSLACDCLAEMEGVEPDTNNPQVELADALDGACLSVWSEVRRRMAGEAA